MEDIENKIVMCKYGDTCDHLVDDKPCKHNKPHKYSIDCVNTTCKRGECVVWNAVGEKEERKMSIYEEIGLNIGTLVTKKQKAYGDSFSKSAEFLKLLYPDGIKPDQYLDILTLVRIYDKIQRIATDKDAFGESPYSDIIGYGILGKAKDKK